MCTTLTGIQSLHRLSARFRQTSTGGNKSTRGREGAKRTRRIWPRIARIDTNAKRTKFLFVFIREIRGELSLLRVSFAPSRFRVLLLPMRLPQAILFDMDGTLTEPLLDFPRI